MSAAVDADLARYLRDCDDEDRRELEIDRLALAYRSDAAKLGDAVTWLDHDTIAHKRLRIHVGALVRAAMDYATVRGSAIGTLVAVQHAGTILSEEPEFDAILRKLAERAAENAERYPDAND